MLIEFIDKVVLIKKPILKDVLIFLGKTYLKIALDNSRKIGYCKVNLCDVCIELYRICVKIQITLK